MTEERPSGMSPVKLYLESLKKRDTEAIAKAAAEIAKEAGISENDPNFVNQLMKARVTDSLGKDDIVIPGLEIDLKNADSADLLKQFVFAEELVRKLGIKKMEKIAFRGWRGPTYAVIQYPRNFIDVRLCIDPDQSFMTPYFCMVDGGYAPMPEERISENKVKMAEYFRSIATRKIQKRK